jgi:predicted metalloprotease with PDZ domain
MDLGVKLCETTGLEHPGREFRSIYWGGAVIALLADVEARRRTNGETGLEDALRKGVARGWDATHVLPLADTLRAIDDTFGSDILTGLAARYADQGNPLRLEPVLAELGVERREKGVLLHDDAPLAAVRRTIMYGDAAPRPDLGVRRRP